MCNGTILKDAPKIIYKLSITIGLFIEYINVTISLFKIVSTVELILNDIPVELLTEPIDILSWLIFSIDIFVPDKVFVLNFATADICILLN